MGNGWPEVPIGEIALPVERSVAPIPGVTYRQVGVRLWGQGAYEREPIDGGATKYKTLNRVESGDIIVNKIWARNGSVAVVADELAGCHGSGEFPTFKARPDKLLPRWFHWATRTRWFWHRCDLQSRGTSGKNRIRPEKFLAIRIPLPPLSEQRQIVAKIDRLAEKIEEARGLRCTTELEGCALYESALTAAMADLGVRFRQDTFGNVCEVVRGGSPRPAGSPVYYDGAIPFLKVADITKDGTKYVSTYSATIKEAGLQRSSTTAHLTFKVAYNSGVFPG